MKGIHLYLDVKMLTKILNVLRRIQTIKFNLNLVTVTIGS